MANTSILVFGLSAPLRDSSIALFFFTLLPFTLFNSDSSLYKGASRPVEGITALEKPPNLGSLVNLAERVLILLL